MKNSQFNPDSIACELVPMDEYDNIESPKKRFGRYHGTNFWNIRGYGRKVWVVASRIRILEPHLFSGLNDRELVERCIRFLNTPPPRKKYAKKQPTPKYGNLDLYSFKRVVHENTQEASDPPSVFSVLLKVSKSKNKLFWGKGKNV